MIRPLDSRVVVDEGARQDLAEAMRFYRSPDRELARAFLDAVAAAITTIAGAPHRWPELGEGYRRYVLRRFPYLVIYEWDGATIVISAIAHGRRRPDDWHERG